MADRSPLGVLLLGGNRTHQESYGRAFAADPRCRLVAVAEEAGAPEQRHALNRALAEELRVPYLPDLEEALRLPDVDLVSVCVEHERRARVAVRAAEAGKHLYLDKPSSCSVPGARAIAEAAEAAGVQSQVFSLIHTPWGQSAIRTVERGELGRLTSIHVELMFAKGAPGTARIGSPRVQEPHPRRFTFPDSKRELRATGVYAVALILRLTGERVASVYGFTANYFFEEHQRNGAEDFGLISMQLESGVSATVAAGRIGVQSHPGGGPMQVTLVGEHGSVTLDAARPRLEVFCDEPVWSPPPSDPSDPMSFWRSTQVAAGGPPKQGWLPLRDGQDDAVAFVDCLVSGARPAVTARDGAAAVETLMAAYVSASRGQPVVPAEIDWPAN